MPGNRSRAEKGLFNRLVIVVAGKGIERRHDFLFGLRMIDLRHIA